MSESDQPYVGGQAVIEGVMMRAPRCMAVAVRRADGTIAVREDAWTSIWERWRFLRWPGFRGSVVLAESVYNGMQALNFSANQAGASGPTTNVDARPAAPASRAATETAPITEAAEGEAPPPGESPGAASVASDPSPSDPSPSDPSPSDPSPSDASPSDPSPSDGSWGTMAVSFAFAIALFVGLPHLLAWGAGKLTGAGSTVDSFGFHVLDGVFKLAIFVGYIAAISMIPEIRRVFQYHGAEHKVVNVYENGLPVTLENARRFTTFHARCGTSFVLFVLVMSIFMFAAVFPFIPKVSDIALFNHLAMILIKIPLMLPLAGLAYEVNRFAARHPQQWWVQLLVTPGRLMQRLTTREPDDHQLEIAIAAMRAALRRDRELVEADRRSTASVAVQSADPSNGEVVVFRNFDEVLEALPSTPTAGLTTAPVH